MEGRVSGDGRKRADAPKLLSKQGYNTTLAINRYVVRHLKGLQRDFQQVLSVPEGSDWKSGEYIISNVISAVGRLTPDRAPFLHHGALR